jgi:hypothetical protein
MEQTSWSRCRPSVRPCTNLQPLSTTGESWVMHLLLPCISAPGIDSQSLSSDLSPILECRLMMQFSILTLQSGVSDGTLMSNTYQSPISTCSIMTELTIFTFFPITQCWPTTLCVTVELSPRRLEAFHTESVETCAFGSMLSRALLGSKIPSRSS